MARPRFLKRSRQLPSPSDFRAVFLYCITPEILGGRRQGTSLRLRSLNGRPIGRRDSRELAYEWLGDTLPTELLSDQRLMDKVEFSGPAPSGAISAVVAQTAHKFRALEAVFARRVHRRQIQAPERATGFLLRIAGHRYPVRDKAASEGVMTTGLGPNITSGAPTAVIHLPHASTVLPLQVRDQFVVSDGELADEIRVMTDHLTDDLFAVSDAVALAVRFPVSRLVVDPERFEADEQEPMTARGMGVVYERTSRQTPLRRPLAESERQALLERWYRPHHRALSATVETLLEARDSCLIIDAHSFPSIPLPYETDQDPDRPDICIGSDEFHTPPTVTELAVTLCRQAGWTVAVNRPFAGALVPMTYHRRDARVRSVMIEVNRRLYLDEQTAKRGTHFDDCRAILVGVIHALVNAGETISSIPSGLWRAYETTTFCATIDGIDIRITPGNTHPSLDRLLGARGVTSWAFITAWNPGSRKFSRHENDIRHERLKNDVKGLGFQAFEGEGRPADPAWAPEQSLLVFGVSAEQAIRIGRRHGQSAIVVGEAGRKARLSRCVVDV